MASFDDVSTTHNAQDRKPVHLIAPFNLMQFDIERFTEDRFEMGGASIQLSTYASLSADIIILSIHIGTTLVAAFDLLRRPSSKL